MNSNRREIQADKGNIDAKRNEIGDVVLQVSLLSTSLCIIRLLRTYTGVMVELLGERISAIFVDHICIHFVGIQ